MRFLVTGGLLWAQCGHSELGFQRIIILPLFSVGDCMFVFAGQLNNGQTVPDRRTSLNSLFSSSKRKGVAIVIIFIVLLAGIVALCASFVMLGMLGVQQARIRSLQSELEALKAENVVCKNETTSLSLQLTTCEKELQGTQHQIEINSAQCELEKGNITAKLEAEIRKGEHEKELAQEKLNTCEGGKEDLSQRLESQTRNAEAEKTALGDKLDRCEQEKREMSRTRDEEIQQQVAERVAANNRESSRWSQSRPNGAERVESLTAVLFLASMLLPLLFKGLHVV